MSLRVTASALALALAGFAGNVEASRYNFNYDTYGAEQVGIDRTFDDGANTVLAFFGPVGANRPTIATADGRVLSYRTIGRYILLPGLQRQPLIVYSGGAVAQIRYAQPQPTYPPMSSPAMSPAIATAHASPVYAVATPAAPLSPAMPAPVLAADSPVHAAEPASAPQPARTLPDTVLASAPAPVPPPVATEPASTASLAAVAGEVATPITEAPAPPTWTATHGMTVRSAIEQWAKTAGWNVVWEAPFDYEIVGTLTYEGEFVDALRGIFGAHANADRKFAVDAYTRQQIIHISE